MNYKSEGVNLLFISIEIKRQWVSLVKPPFHDNQMNPYREFVYYREVCTASRFPVLCVNYHLYRRAAPPKSRNRLSYFFLALFFLSFQQAAQSHFVTIGLLAAATMKAYLGSASTGVPRSLPCGGQNTLDQTIICGTGKKRNNVRQRHTHQDIPCLFGRCFHLILSNLHLPFPLSS